MKQFLSILLVAVSTLGAHAQKRVINDPNAEARQVASFHAISVGDGIDLYLSQDEKESAAVSASEEEYRKNIRTDVENGVLKIWYDKHGKWFRGLNGKKLKAYVSFKNIDKLVASGASDVYLTGAINATDFELVLSGASDLKDGEINAKSLSADLSGASDATVRGKVGTLKVEASGASDFKGYDLTVDNCTASASGASDISITVNVELNARASGASGVYYRGEGKIRELHTSGASSVAKKS